LHRSEVIGASIGGWQASYRRGVRRQLERTIVPRCRRRSIVRFGFSGHGDNLGPLNADYVRLKQWLLNLLSNACKFTQQ
jgi:signal transduction histidine kinase